MTQAQAQPPYRQASELRPESAYAITRKARRREGRELFLCARADLYLCGWSSTEAASREAGVPEALGHRWDPFCSALRSPSHGRHLGIAAGVSVKAISDQLGHASISFTLERYSHVLPSIQDEAAAKVEKLLVA
jgi:hypothetical protein